MQNGDVHLTTIIRGSESLEVRYHRGGVYLFQRFYLYFQLSQLHTYTYLFS